MRTSRSYQARDTEDPSYRSHSGPAPRARKSEGLSGWSCQSPGTFRYAQPTFGGSPVAAAVGPAGGAAAGPAVGAAAGMKRQMPSSETFARFALTVSILVLSQSRDM